MKYRVECNFGSRYFEDEQSARRYFNKCKAKRLDVELWQLEYTFMEILDRCIGVQFLLEYSLTYKPE